MSPRVADVPTLEGFDPLSDAFLADPYPILERARRERPVFYHPPLDFWVVTRHEDILAVVGDFETFSSRAAGTIAPPEELAGRVPANLIDAAFINLDPPRHTIARKNANKAFTRGRIAAMEDDMREIANRIIDRFADDGQCDLMQDYCYELSLLVILRLLGLPEEDKERFRQWTEDLFGVMSPLGESGQPTKPMEDSERMERYTRLAEAHEYYTRLVEDRRANPRDDLVSAMLQQHDEEGNQLIPTDEVITHISELVAAGNDTTANLMGHMVMYFDQDPEQLEAVRAEPELWENAVEEGLRRRGTAPGLFRVTTRDVDLHGTTIPAGSTVWVVFISGGHDEAVFPDPRRFDVRRENPDQHVSFGRGRHMCMGAPLARLEARVGLEELYRRIPDIGVVPEQELHYQPVMTVLTLDHLLVEWG